MWKYEKNAIWTGSEGPDHDVHPHSPCPPTESFDSTEYKDTDEPVQIPRPHMTGFSEKKSIHFTWKKNKTKKKQPAIVVFFLFFFLDTCVYHSLCKFSRRQIDDMFLLFFPQKIGFGISWQLSLKKAICTKYQAYFLGKIREKKNKQTKKTSKCCLLIFLSSMLSVTQHVAHNCSFIITLFPLSVKQNIHNSYTTLFGQTGLSKQCRP